MTIIAGPAINFEIIVGFCSVSGAKSLFLIYDFTPVTIFEPSEPYVGNRFNRFRSSTIFEATKIDVLLYPRYNIGKSAIIGNKPIKGPETVVKTNSFGDILFPEVRT